ncbi:serine hydrolase [Nocardioides mangrovicus]|nr:serine hydrolase [Nocardioides mangrovicus]
MTKLVLVAAAALVAATGATASVPSAIASAIASATTGVTTDHGGPRLAQLVGSQHVTLHRGSARSAGLLPAYARRVVRDAAAGVTPESATTPGVYPGETVIAGRNGVITGFDAKGFALRYADQSGTQLPREEWISTRRSTMYDLASLSKLFTSIVAVQQLEKGRLDLDRTVASYLPAYAQNGKGAITIRQLLTHTSGLPPDPSPALWTYPTYQDRIDAILTQTPAAPAGSTYVYSDLNMMSLQLVLEKITGKPLDQLVRQGITKPLHMTSTMYNPPARLRYRIAAEEYQTTPARGLTWGQVHDENAWALNGVAGHAGVFSDAHDLAILAQTMLNGGRYGKARILSKHWVVAMLKNYNQAFTGNEHGLGFELWQHYESGALATPYTGAHTGFTGTSITIDPTTQSFVILLTNRVHPHRTGPTVNPYRRAVADDMARAVRVKPAAGRTAWYAGMEDATTATLTMPVTLPAGRTALRWSMWYDTEPRADFATLEASTDDGTSWTPVPFTLRGKRLSVRTPGSVAGYEGHQWLRARASLAAYSGRVQLRWRYTTDELYHGRGVYVDDVRVQRGRHTILDAERHPAVLDAVGWVASRS